MHDDHRHCAGYARANRGLPAVEDGMPVPAGTGMPASTAGRPRLARA